LVGKTEGKRPLGESGRRRDVIRMNIREIVWEGVTQDRDQWRARVDTIMKLPVP